MLKLISMIISMLVGINWIETGNTQAVYEKQTVDEAIAAAKEAKNNWNSLRANFSLPAVEIDEKLMDATQKAAERLAKFGRLDNPKLNLDSTYYGYATQGYGYSYDGKFIGKEICIGNDMKYKNIVYDFPQKCVLSEGHIALLTKYGFGVAKATDGLIYTVAVYALEHEEPNDSRSLLNVVKTNPTTITNSTETQ